jgi:hypothetical protein
MEGISDIKIKGLDTLRPPMIRKEPYINLYFKLSHKAPKKWCSVFNDLVTNGTYPAKIDSSQGMFIETWVRKPEEIEPLLDFLKKSVKKTIINYIADIEAEALANAPDAGGETASKEQILLNVIISNLDFES